MALARTGEKATKREIKDVVRGPDLREARRQDSPGYDRAFRKEARTVANPEQGSGRQEDEAEIKRAGAEIYACHKWHLPFHRHRRSAGRVII